MAAPTSVLLASFPTHGPGVSTEHSLRTMSVVLWALLIVGASLWTVTAAAQEAPAPAPPESGATNSEGPSSVEGAPQTTSRAGADASPAAEAKDPAAHPDSSAIVDPLALIEVVPGGPPVRMIMAIATPVHVGRDDDPSGMGTQIAGVLRRDFEMSGLFDVAPGETYGALVDLRRDGMTTTTIDFEGWYNIGAAVLVKGSYRIDGNQMEIDLRLFDVDSGRQISLNWSPTTVRSSRYRRVAHDFVNAVIEHYTGERGVFGTRILFAGPGSGKHRQIHSIDNDGFGLSTYDVPGGLNILPSWGPGGSILFTHLADEGDAVFSYDGEALEQLTGMEGWASGPDYCSNNGLLVLTMSLDGNADIYTMHADGTEPTRLTEAEGADTSPSWAPGCKRLAFVSDRDGSPQIYTMRADGTSVRRLTWVGNYNTTPEWSPKGDLVVFTARDERRRFDVFTVNVGSGEVIRLTQDQGNNEEPSWAPDGRYLVFQSTRDGRQPRLYMMTSDGRWQTRISDAPGFRTPRWQR